MSSALSIALSALQAQSEGIDTVGNNLANMNTTGFKGSMVDFEDLMSQYMGVGSGLAMGTGVARPINQQLFTQGPLQSSSSPLATAIQGNGFFVVTDPSSGAQEFTRDGNFTISDTGALQTQTGENVQGWTVSANGVVNTSTPPSNIVLPTGTVLPPKATQNLSLTANLNANTPAKNSWSTTVDVVDSLGNTHTLTASFTNAGNDTWNYQISIPAADLTAASVSGNPGPTLNNVSTTSGAMTITVPGASIAGIAVGQTVTGANFPAGTTVTNISTAPDVNGNYTVTLSQAATVTGTSTLTFSPAVLASGTLNFNQNGTLTSVTPSGGAASTNPVSLNINGLADGAANMNINWNLFDPNNNGLFTQYAQGSGVSSTQQDGVEAAQLTSVSIQTGGQVVAMFSNSQQKVLAQLALASIQNPDSLVNVGNNNFAATASTSAPAIGLPQTGGRGQILGGQLEGSNVDMATEFTNLITYQSGYQASSRVITTVDQMTQDLMNLIR